MNAHFAPHPIGATLVAATGAVGVAVFLRPPFIPQVVARVGARGVTRRLRYHDGQALAKGEFVINLVRKKGDRVVVTDAWYFKDGDGERWNKTRYREFRVNPDGKALLVGLRGPNLEKL